MGQGEGMERKRHGGKGTLVGGMVGQGKTKAGRQCGAEGKKVGREEQTQRKGVQGTRQSRWGSGSAGRTKVRKNQVYL